MSASSARRPRSGGSAPRRTRRRPVEPTYKTPLRTAHPDYHGEPLSVGRAVDILQSWQVVFPVNAEPARAQVPMRLFPAKPVVKPKVFDVARYLGPAGVPTPQSKPETTTTVDSPQTNESQRQQPTTSPSRAHRTPRGPPLRAQSASLTRQGSYRADAVAAALSTPTARETADVPGFSTGRHVSSMSSLKLRPMSATETARSIDDIENAVAHRVAGLEHDFLQRLALTSRKSPAPSTVRLSSARPSWTGTSPTHSARRTASPSPIDHGDTRGSGGETLPGLNTTVNNTSPDFSSSPVGIGRSPGATTDDAGPDGLRVSLTTAMAKADEFALESSQWKAAFETESRRRGLLSDAHIKIAELKGRVKDLEVRVKQRSPSNASRLWATPMLRASSLRDMRASSPPKAASMTQTIQDFAQLDDPLLRSTRRMPVTDTWRYQQRNTVESVTSRFAALNNNLERDMDAITLHLCELQKLHLQPTAPPQSTTLPIDPKNSDGDVDDGSESAEDT